MKCAEVPKFFLGIFVHGGQVFYKILTSDGKDVARKKQKTLVRCLQKRVRVRILHLYKFYPSQKNL